MAWNGSDGKVATSASRTAAKKPSRVRGLIAGLVVVVLAAVVYFSFFSCNVDDSVSVVDDSKLIKETQPRKARKVTDSNVKKRTSEGKMSVAKPTRQETPVQDVAETVSMNVATSTATATPKDKRLFKNPMDQLLLLVMPKYPGGQVPPLPDIGNIEFTPAEEERLLERLAESKDDTNETLDRKELVQSLRDEYHELKKERNWSFVDYVKALEAKVRLDAEVLSESIKIHETVFNDKSISDAAYLEMLEKINKVLADRGIAPIGQHDEEVNGHESGNENVKGDKESK